MGGDAGMTQSVKETEAQSLLGHARHDAPQKRSWATYGAISALLLVGASVVLAVFRGNALSRPVLGEGAEQIFSAPARGSFPPSMLLHPAHAGTSVESGSASDDAAAPSEELPVFVCAPPKTGSTTLRVWMTEAYGGVQPGPEGGINGATVFEEAFDQYSERLGFEANQANQVPKYFQQQREAGNSELKVRRKVAFVRDPIARAGSAFANKLACNAHVDKGDRNRILNSWRSCAATFGLPALADIVAEDKICLEPHEFIQALRLVQPLNVPAAWNSGDSSKADCLNQHFMPWSQVCRFDHWQYDELVPTTQMESWLSGISEELHLPGRVTTGVTHESLGNKPDLFAPDDVAFIKEFYAADYAAFHEAAEAGRIFSA